MTATTSVERDSLIRVIKTAALMSIMIEAQKTIHENHVYTDSPEISFGLVSSTRSLELLNEKIILRLGDMIGVDAAKSAFNEALKMLCDEQIDTLDQLTKAILKAIGDAFRFKQRTTMHNSVGTFYEICAEYKGHLIRRYFWDEQRTRPRLLYSSFVGSDLLTDTTLKGIKTQIDNVAKVI